MHITDRFAFFWGSRDPFSNWHPSPFNYRGLQFENVEQFMMFGKAQLFGDTFRARIILNTPDPKACKRHGRLVQGFQHEIWDKEGEKIVQIGLREKFLQNPALLTELLRTGDRMLVEASPYDKIWGIGMKSDHPDAQTPELWRGENRLGRAMTRTRHILVAGCLRQRLPERAQSMVEDALDQLGYGRSEPTSRNGPSLG